MGFERYKLVVQVELGEKKGQAVSMVSRCLWDTNTDNFASEGYETETLFCNCQVSLLKWGLELPLTGWTRPCSYDGVSSVPRDEAGPRLPQVYGLYFE